jgi:hypothetical protein
MFSPAAAALLRALIARAECGRDWMLLSDIRSTEWRSLTFTGERHEIEVKLLGATAWLNGQRLVAGLRDAEFDIAGHLVADIAVTAGPARSFDGAVVLTIEALTIEE